MLVISGRLDLMFTPGMEAELAKHLPRGKHLNVAKAGHLVIAEYPELINRAIAQMLQELRPSEVFAQAPGLK